MQTHIVLPHHHHHNSKETPGHSHNHKHDHGHEQGKHPDSGRLGDLIGHEAHQNTSAEILPSTVQEHSVKKADIKVPFIAKAEYLFKYPKVPSSSQYTSQDLDFYKSDHFHSFQLRGPPAYIL
ncbi:hypothetical protein I5M27_02520 [Adhaeribacter sp. BT258]|uniref:Uncharacterized protein n=1 Tax=Adhaeribacter terrigena TaxID=2793070 RepID=A0ABS1C016_9BACT|nr:hypothetical protein [Adhaeribacter terrigena]MBK0401840.1 hypothetical protein [Adhaeribacter terrigena]